MRILHIISGLGTGGAERMLERLVDRRVDGVEHIVVSLGGQGPVGARMAAAGVTVLALELDRRRLIFALPRLIRLIRRTRPDIVQTWLYHADVLGGVAARLAGVRAVAWSIRTADTRAGISLSRSARAMLRAGAVLSARVPARIVYVAEAARRSHEAEGYARAPGIILHNGFVMPDPAATAAAARDVRRSLGIADGALVVGTAGTFTAQKNQVGFVAACADLLRTRDDIHLLVIGAGNTAGNERLGGAARATGHPDRVHLLGERRDIAACLASLDLFCLASRGEGFPNVVGEAMAVGVPVITTDVGDAALIVGDTGTVVPVDDHDALRDGLDALLRRSRAELSAMGDRARTRIVDNFALDVARDRYLMLYRSMLAKDPR